MKLTAVEQESVDKNEVKSFSIIDIGVLDKNNTDQMLSFFKIRNFEIPNDIARNDDNNSFPYRLLKKTLHNGENCNRDWLCWRSVKQSLYCVPCFSFNKPSMNSSSLANESGWSIIKGW